MYVTAPSTLRQMRSPPRVWQQSEIAIAVELQAQLALQAEKQSTAALAARLQDAVTNCEAAHARIAVLEELPRHMDRLRGDLQESDSNAAQLAARADFALSRCEALQAQLNAKEATAAVMQRELQASSLREKVSLACNWETRRACRSKPEQCHTSDCVIIKIKKNTCNGMTIL